MKEHMAKMWSRMELSGRSGEVVQMHHLFRACTSDVITVYAFGDSFHFLDKQDYGTLYFEATNLFFALTHVFGHFPWFALLVQSAPAWIVRTFFPSLKELLNKQTVCPFTPRPELSALKAYNSGGSRRFARSEIHQTRIE